MEPRRADRLFAFLLLVVIAARLAILFSTQYHTNGDEAAIGVMAQRILEGERPLHPSVADRHAGSALAGYSAAAALAVFGVSEAALKTPPLVWSVLALVLLYLMVRAVEGAPAALLVAALYATSIALMKWSYYAPGGYVVCQALFPAVFWLLLARATVPGRAGPWHDLLLGLLCGLGSALLVLFAPAAITVALFLLLAGASARTWARLLRFAAGLAVGCAPLWFFARAVEQNAPTTFVDNLGSFPLKAWAALTVHLPAMMAYDNIEGAPAFRLVPNGVAYGVLLSGLALLVACRGPALWRRIRDRVARHEGGDVPLEAPMLVYSIVYVALYCVHPFTGTEARHLIPLEPALSILAGLGLAEAFARGRRAPLLAGVAALLAAAAFANAAVQHGHIARDHNVRGMRTLVDPHTARSIAALLEDEGVRRIVTDDWDLAWRMSFLTRGRIVGCHAVAEHKAWLDDEELHRAHRYAVAVRAGSHRDHVLAQRTRRAGVTHERHVVREKAVHVLGPPEGNAQLPEQWCPPELLLEPVSAARARSTG